MKLGLAWTKLINFALFQAGWFACVLGAAFGRVWLGTSLGLVFVLIHLTLAPFLAGEMRLLGTALCVGLVVDSAHIGTGALVCFEGSVFPGLAPPWILVLWMQIASTLRFSLSWLEGRYVFGCLLGACCGVLAYAAGVRLGAAGFGPDPTFALLQIGAGWGLALPLLLFLARKTAHGDEAARYQFSRCCGLSRPACKETKERPAGSRWAFVVFFPFLGSEGFSEKPAPKIPCKR